MLEQSDLRRLIDDHPDLIDRVWTAVQRDVSGLYSKKPKQTSDRNKHILTSRLSPGDDYYEVATLQELGEIYGVSRERVRQVEEKGKRLLQTLLRKKRKSWTYGVLNEYRNFNRDESTLQFYSDFFELLAAGDVSDKFASFVIFEIGKIDGLAAGDIERLETSFRRLNSEKKRWTKRDAAPQEQRDKQESDADEFVATVLAKSTFSGAFAAEGIDVKQLPRLRPCSRGRQIFSETLGRFVQWESQGERRFIEALDRSSIISEFAEQPVEIQFLYEGELRSYFVDLLIKTVDDLTVAIEIKAPVMLADSDVLAKAKAAESVLGEHGIGYCLVDANGRSRQDILKAEPGDTLKRFLRETLRAKRKVTMRDLREYLGEWPSQEISDQIQCLVLQHGLDFRVKLIPDQATGRLGRNYTFELSLTGSGGPNFNS